MRTFFLPAGDWHEPWKLQGQEARHLVKVLRVKAGEEIRLLDGQGREGVFTVSGTQKDSVLLTPRTLLTHEKPDCTVTLAMGYTRAVRRSWLFEKAVELEAGGLWLWQAEYSQAALPRESKESWLAQMEAGAKQCANPWLPELRTLPDGIADLARAKEQFSAAYILWEEETRDKLLQLENLRVQGPVLVVMGPEGGFSPKEVCTLRGAGFASVSLGKRILRWETAALLTLGLAWYARQSPA